MIVDLLDKETNKIVFNYYLKEYKDTEKSINEYKKLNTLLKYSKDTRLVRFGDIVFLLRFENNEVEFHSMGQEASSFRFIKNLKQLFDYARTLKVYSISSYSNEIIFDKIVSRMNLGITKDIKVGSDGTAYNYYRLEL